jgi:hypothetical protein
MLNEDVCNTKIIKIILNNLEAKLQTLSITLEKRRVMNYSSVFKIIIIRFKKLFLLLFCLLAVMLGYYFYIYVRYDNISGISYRV